MLGSVFWDAGFNLKEIGVATMVLFAVIDIFGTIPKINRNLPQGTHAHRGPKYRCPAKVSSSDRIKALQECQLRAPKVQGSWQAGASAMQ